MALKGLHRRRKFGFKLGNIPHNKGQKDAKVTDKAQSAARNPRTIKRLTRDVHERVTRSGTGHKAMTASEVMLLRPKAKKALLVEKNAASVDLRYFYMFLN